MGEIVKLVGGTAAIVVAIGLFVRMLVTHWLSKDVERHKAKLDTENQKAMERLRADNARLAVEHEARFRRVDEKVAERLEETLKRLHRLNKSVHKLVAILEWSGGPTKDELWRECNEANKDFNDYYFPNRCYVPPALDAHIKQLANTLVNIASDFSRSQQENRPQTVDYWHKAWEAAEKEATPLFSLMLTVIRKRLGVEDTDAELVLLNALPPIQINTGEKKV